MKRIAYSFFLVALLSCGSAPSSSTNRIKIEFRDSVIGDYYLLALRESSLIITPYTTDYTSMDALNASAQVVPFGKIAHLYKVSRVSFGDELWYGLGGFAIGSCSSGIAASGCGGSGDGHPDKFNFTPPIILSAIGLLAGVVFEGAYEELYLDTKEHLDKVKRRAVYKEGEPDLLKLMQ